ncbi:methionine--tRNA ligase [bacterium]|nr:methionine--tRNA ligase [bacterium]
MAKKKFYITTAIDYVNNVPHLGTSYEKICTDVIARFKRMQGYDVHFQMGNDEHSINVKKAAIEKGLAPKAYCDEMQGKFEEIWQKLEISYDGFIRTTEIRHKAGVQELFRRIYDNKDIYKSSYDGYYCESCEAFYTEKDLVDGHCPHHKTKPKWLKEENYFFALSKYQDKLLKHIKKNPKFILPESRRNEILSLIKGGLDDVSISRSTRDWGITLPIDESHVVYVWFDALINYITAVGFGSDEKMFKKWWPAQIHVIGKDITRFHCVIWPAMLMSAGVKLPETIFGHGFVYLKGEKMSKSLGNVVCPMDVINIYGADPLRYYLVRESSFGRDGDFTWERFIDIYNSDLANGIGNTLSRTIGMVLKYFDGKIEAIKSKPDSMDKKLIAKITSTYKNVEAQLDYTTGDINFHVALANIQEAFAAIDGYIQETAPWTLAKEGKQERLKAILHNIAESLRVLSIILRPFIPSNAAKIWEQLGLNEIGKFEDQDFSSVEKWNQIKKTITVIKSESIFPRIEKKDGVPKEKKSEEKQVMTDTIDITDFSKIDLRIAEILEAEKIEGTDKLLKLQVSLGEEKRQIVAGIAKHYDANDLIGKKVVVVANLKPIKLRGVESHGMLLAASGNEQLSIVTPLNDIPVGSKVK